MPMTITMPQLGETVTEGTVAQWLKRVGDSVEKYEAFVEVSTDKVNAEVPSPVSGIIRELIAQEGETVPTGAPIAVIDEKVAEGEREPATPGPDVTRHDQRSVEVVPANYAAPGPSGSPPNGTPQRISPAVRRLAREHGVDLRSVAGTGSEGRITANDVIAAAGRVATSAQRGAAVLAPEAPQPRTAAPEPRSGAPQPAVGETIPLTQARKLIAQRLVESKHAAPHAWTMVEVDVSDLVTWREREKERFLREKGYPLTLLPFFLHAAVQALKAFPLLNARFSEDGIFMHREVNVGIAVALDANLIVPVIRAADDFSIGGLAVAAGRLIERARSGKLSADELTGGTFTVNNTGANGSILSAPIIHAGQAGIVTMEAVVKRPVVVAGDAIAIRSMMNACLSLDHRVLDGAVASAFLNDLKKRLQAMGPTGEL